MFDVKNVGSKHNVGSKRFWVQNIWGPHKKDFCPKNIYAEIGVPTNFVSKKFCVQRIFGSKIILGPKKSWVQKKFGLNKFGVKKIFG